MYHNIIKNIPFFYNISDEILTFMSSWQFLQSVTMIHLSYRVKACNEVCFINNFQVENYIKRPYTIVFKFKLFNNRNKCISVGRILEVKVASLDFVCLLGVKPLC